ncbi:MAG: hypothetical protein IJG84_04795 [Kiritimatiellae bacterium]|nr:hypothetical protein [Kiritimatiellia bacterium]
MMKRVVYVSMGLGFALTSAAVDFPNADGSGDLASETAWGEVAHDSSSAVSITASGTYTASSDVTFSKLTVNPPWSGSVVFDMTAAGSGKVTLQGTAWDKFSIARDLASVEFWGGVWDFGSGGSIYAGSSTNARNQPHTWRILHGAVVTNVATLYVANYDASNTLVVAENSSFSATTVNILSPTQYSLGSGIEILSGGRFKATGAFKTDTGQANSPVGDSYVHVSGASSRLDLAGYTYIGYKCPGNELVVTNGATASFTGSAVYLGNSATSPSNRMVVADGGTATFGSGTTWYMGGDTAGSDGNTFDILDGGSVTFSRVSYMGNKGRDNVVTVSNATLNCYSLVWGNDGGCSGNSLVVGGTNPVVSASSSLNFKNGSRIVVRLPDSPYAPACVPISAATLTMDATCALAVENLSGYVEKSKGRSKVVVATATSSLTIPDAVLTAANAELSGSGAYFFFEENGKKLCLHAPVVRGLAIIFK